MIAFVFPGQGSQFSGMGKDLADNFAVAKDIFAEANDALGFDIAGMCFSGPDEALKLTANTQPAILTTSVAALRVLQQEKGLKPAYVAGHSLGEYSALVATGALAFADAVKTVHQRGTFMQEAVPVGTGAMAAVIGIDAAELDQLCREAAQGDAVAPANFNSPGQIVIAGHAAAVERALELAKERGAKRAMLLPVSAPFHSSLMAPAALRLQEVLAPLSVNPLSVPLVSNVEAAPYQDHSRVKELLVEQVCAPVRWDESVQCMQRLGVTRYVEIGPGKVLTGLIKRIDRQAELVNICDLDSLAKA
ncbi:ACP S-malonyltransferase [Pelobacter seleniigenes]|uniref:ACP S-malonyltransferase n=1 Tax=Pelobacter seleniigenes TaxID=407188 RepID=UPI0004A6F7B2|nr:ACP S-malonyltransferase [Pelobacter seleniigenes]